MTSLPPVPILLVEPVSVSLLMALAFQVVAEVNSSSNHELSQQSMIAQDLILGTMLCVARETATE
jgi:hypothetical protein